MLKLYYALTLSLSAFLLFLIQPMFSKMILPMLGGAPAVWTTSMLFFQTLLLLGYLYAHIVQKFLKPKTQILAQIVLFAVFILNLPISISVMFGDTDFNNPLTWQVLTMLVSIGGPFFMLSSMAPLMQSWFSTKTEGKQEAYTLYAASNIGSLGALLLYPFVIEANFGLNTQAWGWSAGYAILIALVCGVFASSLKHFSNEKDTDHFDSPKIPARTFLTWVLYAFIPSALMISATSYITLDLAPIPLLWIVPFALYIATYIHAFSKKKLLSLNNLHFFIFILLIPIAFFTAGFITGLNMLQTVGITLFVFTLIALYFHERLYAARPNEKALTLFYFAMSLGGVLGGLFNAILAPILFTQVIEYKVVIIAAALIFAFFSTSKGTYRDLQIAVSVIAAMALIYAITNPYRNAEKKITYESRSFYGPLKVFETKEGQVRHLQHGATLHGTQYTDPQWQLEPLSYYIKAGPAGYAARHIKNNHPNANIAAIGLGIGTLACHDFGRNAKLIFFELDPHVINVAKDPKHFTYLSKCPNKADIILGDGRLKIAEQPDNSYDLIVVDAFSSDHVPVHLITTEAIELYFSKLKKDGMLLIHISNRSFKLDPLIQSIANDAGVHAFFGFIVGEKLKRINVMGNNAIYGVLMRDKKKLLNFVKSSVDFKPIHEWGKLHPGTKLPAPWTDQYSNILDILNKHERKQVVKATSSP